MNDEDDRIIQKINGSNFHIPERRPILKEGRLVAEHRHDPEVVVLDDPRLGDVVRFTPMGRTFQVGEDGEVDAAAFVAWIRSPEGERLLARHGIAPYARTPSPSPSPSPLDARDLEIIEHALDATISDATYGMDTPYEEIDAARVKVRTLRAHPQGDAVTPQDPGRHA